MKMGVGATVLIAAAAAVGGVAAGIGALGMTSGGTLTRRWVLRVAMFRPPTETLPTAGTPILRVEEAAGEAAGVAAEVDLTLRMANRGVSCRRPVRAVRGGGVRDLLSRSTPTARGTLDGAAEAPEVEAGAAGADGAARAAVAAGACFCCVEWPPASESARVESVTESNALPWRGDLKETSRAATDPPSVLARSLCLFLMSQGWPWRGRGRRSRRSRRPWRRRRRRR